MKPTDDPPESEPPWSRFSKVALVSWLMLLAMLAGLGLLIRYLVHSLAQ